MGAWTLFPTVIVRSTGFPFEIVERIRFDDAAPAARRLAWETSQFEKYKSTAPRVHRPSKELLSLIKAGKPIPPELASDPQMFGEWNRFAEAVLAASLEFAGAFTQNEAQQNAEIERLREDPRFLEAIASSSPPVYQDLRRGRLNNRVQRQLGSYIQRCAAKNETMSFFGPINYGRVDPSLPEGVALKWSGPVVAGRRSFPASWLTQGLYRKIAFHPEVLPWLVFRKKGFREAPSRTQRRGRLGDILLQMGVVTSDQVRNGLARQASTRQRLGEILVNTGVLSSSDLARALEQQAQRAEPTTSNDMHDLLPKLVQAADGTRTVKALAEVLGWELKVAQEYVQIGCERGFLTHQLEIPPTAHRPIEDLIERLAGIPGTYPRQQLGLLAQVLGFLSRYGAAPAEEKVRLNDELRAFAQTHWGIEHASAGPALTEEQQAAKNRRGEGHNFYADRLPIREEAHGDLDLKVGGDRARELIERCEPALELMAIAAVETREASRRALGAMIGVRELPLWRVITALGDRPIPYDTRLTSAITAAVLDPNAQEVSLDGVKLTPPAGLDDLPVWTSVDLLVGAESVEQWHQGRYQLVMGDVHDTWLVWGWALQFHPDRVGVEAQALLAQGQLPRSMPLVTMMPSRRTGLIPSEFPGAAVEVGGTSGRASPWRLMLDDLFVKSDGQIATLYSKALQQEVCLYNGELESIVHTAFALPRIRPMRLQLASHTPRLTMNGVILQREQWKLTAEMAEKLLTADDDKERLHAGIALWDELGLPEAVFAKLKGERKPLLVDVRSPLLLRVFANLLGQREEAWLSEMVPGPRQLWLRNGEKERYTSELRCSFYRTGVAKP